MVSHSKGGANRDDLFTSLNKRREAPILVATGWHFYFFFLRFPFMAKKKRNNQAKHRTYQC
jgi:hypothetical protein